MPSDLRIIPLLPSAFRGTRGDEPTVDEFASTVSTALGLGAAAKMSIGVPGGVATFEQALDAALNQTTQELAGPPTDLPPGKQRLVWNTTKNAPSFWMNRGGTVIDAFDPGTF